MIHHPHFEAIRTKLGRGEPERVTGARVVEAAVALILLPTSDGDLEALFIKRAEVEGDPWSGQMALPGGRRDPVDDDLLATAARETLEETGIDLAPPDLLGELDDLAPNARVLPPVVIRSYVGAIGLRDRPEVSPSAEVALYLWVPFSELQQSATTVDIELRKARTTVQAFVVGDHVIWGLTHRIITPFVTWWGKRNLSTVVRHSGESMREQSPV